MSFNASSYFAGVGTVAVVMAIGFGAGMHMTGLFDEPISRTSSSVAPRAFPRSPRIRRLPEASAPSKPRRRETKAL